ncbi:MAG: pectinesterase family protein [Sphaerochaeta sp.]|uniref:pectinesterase family protein n=1 Tax=Sphaerochaeta sp. TaxID=1972642 RepID=UPI002FCA0B4A
MQEHIISVGPGSSINEALQSIGMSSESVIIQLEAGVYTEKVFVDRPNVTIRGRGRENTRISFNDAAMTERDGRSLGTFASATLTATKPNFKAEKLCIANDFDYDCHRALVARNPGKVKGLQAVAFRSTGSSDHTLLSDCSFIGHQDTLLLDAGTHLVQGCRIEGNIDFIFGSGTVLFEQCTIVSNGPGYVSAPSTKVEDIGFLFHRCSFTATHVVPRESVYLGRPWHPGADPQVNSYALLYDCYEDAHIHHDGWTWMHAFPPGGGEVVFTAESSRFFETSCSGPGSSNARESLAENEVITIVQSFLMDW